MPRWFQEKLIKSSGIISIGILTSRVFGYIRDVLIAFYFGASKLTDAFFIAWMIPNTFREVVGEGGLNASFLPVFSATYMKDKNYAVKFASSFLTLLILGCIILTIFGVGFSDFLIKLIAPGFVKFKIHHIASLLTKFLFPYIILISACALLMCILISQEKFAITSFVSSLLNISMILGLISFYKSLSIFSLVIGILIGGAIQLITLFWAVYKNKIKISLSMPYFFKYKELKKVFLLLIPRLFSTGILHLNIIVSRLLGSLIGEGAVSALYYANRLIHLPLALFGISVSTAIMPGIISSYERKDTKAMKLQIYQAIKLILLVNLPSMIILILFGKFIIKILFEHGKFSLVQTNLTYQALAFYSIGLIAYSTTRVLTAVYHAMQNTKIPLYISIISLIINFLLCIILMNYLGVGGIALASSIAAITNSLLLGFILIKKNFNLR